MTADPASTPNRPRRSLIAALCGASLTLMSPAAHAFPNAPHSVTADPQTGLSANAQNPKNVTISVPDEATPTVTSGARELAADEHVQTAHFDLEIDPLAYVAQGYSLHLGVTRHRFRLDLGAFGALVPEFLHGQRDFENRMAGYGAKLDVYLLHPEAGPFVGVEGAWLQQHVVDEISQVRIATSGWSLGGRAGWTFTLPAQFYIKPWIGVGYRFGETELRVASRSFEQSRLLIFPTFHVGYTFE